ncbi:MAG: M28 family peptidase [Saprospiraceae bacterium]|nr:M28 family peptidase [Saprospiraceae bacterium]
MKVFHFLLALLLFVSCSRSLDIPGEDPVQQMTIDIGLLASDEMEGREVGTEGENMAAAYLVERFKDIGLKPMGTNGFYQEFRRKVKSNPHAAVAETGDPEIVGKNVVAYLDNKAENTVVIGAHFDHLGYGKEGSLYTGVPAIHNGADDNASGVSMMVYLASVLKKSKLKHNNFLFIGFSGEEKGLWGSNYFVNNPTIPVSKMNYMINMDMVGRLNADRQLALSGTGTSPSFKTVLEEENKYKLKLKLSESGIGPSDHTSFYLQDIPVLAFFTGQHEDYHKPSDDIQLLNFSGMRDISAYVYKIIARLDRAVKLSFTKTKDESTDAPKFTVSLGVIPDYLYDGKGMRIDGVREGKPAFKADLQKGDIVLKMNDMEVTDMMSYMKALAAFKQGDSAKLLIKRGDQEIIKEVKFE